jgi:hypothetical protein
MQSMFGGGAPQEDMFAKLDQMREIITEVNTQFKDPVRPLFLVRSGDQADWKGEDDIRLCLHFRILIALRNGTINPRIDRL